MMSSSCSYRDVSQYAYEARRMAYGMSRGCLDKVSSSFFRLPFEKKTRINFYMDEQIDLSDDELIARICDGDHRAFSVLVERHTQMFFGAAYKICGHVQEAEDIVQEAFLKFWKKPQAFDAAKGVKFTTWFYRVVTNVAIDAGRKNKARYTHAQSSAPLDYLEDRDILADERLVLNEEEASIEHAIQALPERQKMALNLCFYDGLSNKDAAEVLGVGVKALESLLMRAKQKLREDLGQKHTNKKGGTYD